MHVNHKKRHESLKELIHQHDYAYHVLDQPQITDYEYDQLYNELLDLEKKYHDLNLSDSPSQRVGNKPLDVFEKVNHRLPMISLSNTYSSQDLIDFDLRIKKFLKSDQEIEYFCTPKFDGLAIELVYKNGIFTQALTRGDGTTGEDVTQNVKTITSVPLKLKTKNPPPLVEIRGEILIFKNDFEQLNQSQQDLGVQTFANPRNAAAGTIRQLDPRITASRPLHFFAHSLGAYEGIDFDKQSSAEDFFKSWGLPVCESKLKTICTGPQKVISFYEKVEKLRHDLEFEIDGIVIKVNDFRLQNDLGFIAKSPRWATAAKYKPQQAESKIIDIIVQVGRTGALTPVAIMAPTKVGGVTITNATLHNQEEINRKDIRIGDSVLIQRAGDVIPEVVSIIPEKRMRDSQPFLIPSRCPVCHTQAQKLEGEVITRCMNPICPAIMKESLKHFVQRRAMNMDKVGDKIIDALYDARLVRKFSDFYLLKKEDILSLDRQGEKSAQNIIDSIQKSKETTLPKFIYSLGIRFVGEQTAKSLADHFLNIHRFLETTTEDLLQIPDIGPKVADSILKWLSNKDLINEVHLLLKYGVKISESKRNQQGVLLGKSFLITGTLPVKRDEAKELIEKNGGKIMSSVSSKLDYLVVGEDPGSKVEKAESLKVKIISWDELHKLIENR